MQKRIPKFALVLLACWLSLALVGCNRDGKYPVSGVVTWEGEPIPDEQNGHITFTPVDGSTAPDAGKINAEGRFSLRASPGEKRVEILISRPVGDRPPNSPEIIRF